MPILETTRLRLRPFEMEDLADAHRLSGFGSLAARLRLIAVGVVVTHLAAVLEPCMRFSTPGRGVCE